MLLFLKDGVLVQNQEKKNTLKKSKTNTRPAKSKVSKPNGSLDKVSTQNINIKTDITAPADEKTESPK